MRRDIFSRRTKLTHMLRSQTHRSKILRDNSFLEVVILDMFNNLVWYVFFDIAVYT